MRYAFGDWTLDAQRFELRRSAEHVDIEPKVFAVLGYLLWHRERVVSKDELLAQLWPDEHVVDAVVVRCIYEARKALGQKGVYDAPITTVRGRGYRFVGEVTVSDVPGETTRGEPFVGRAFVLQRLSEALDEARGGHGRVVLLSGEAGIGKTRAAEEIAMQARRTGCDVWLGHCHDAQSAPSFWPFTELVRACLRTLTPRQVQAALGASACHLSALLPEAGAAAVAAPRSRDPDAPRDGNEFLLFDAVTRLLSFAATQRPRMLLLEDLHWADLPSLRLLAVLARDLADKALLIVGTLREGELDSTDPRKQCLDGVLRLRRAERIALAPLEEADVQAYIAKLFRGPLPELARALYQRSEGNPFFMVEALRPHLSASPEALAVVRLMLPDASRDLVRQRLARLPDCTRAPLAIAAVIGRAFDPALLSQADDTGALGDQAHVLAALAAAIEHGVLRGSADGLGRLEFTHAFMRDAIYDDLPPALRLQLHARVAEALQRRGLPPYAEIAFHLRSALPIVEPAKVAHSSVLAGHAAAAQHAYHDAAAQYEHALRALDLAVTHDGAPQRIDVLLALGHAYRKASESERAIATFEQAARLAKSEGRASDFTRAVLGLRDSQPLRAVQATPVEALLLEALQRLPESELVLRARLSSRLAAVGPRAQRREMSARATALARGIDDAATLADVLNGRLAAAQDPGEIGERLAIADELESLARAHAEPNWLWEACSARYDVYLRLGDMPATQHALAACEELAREHRDGVMHVEVLRHRTQRALWEGRYADVMASMTEAAELRKHVEHRLASVHAEVQTLWLMRDQGQLGLLGEEMEIFLARQRWAQEMAHAAVAAIYAEKGDLLRARQSLAFYASTEFGNVPYGKDYVATCAHLAVAAARLGDKDSAERIHAMLAPYAEQNVVDRMLLCFGSASHYLGLLAHALGRGEQACTRFEVALVMNARIGAAPAQVRTELALAAVLTEQNRAPERVQQLREHAAHTAARLGMALP